MNIKFDTQDNNPLVKSYLDDDMDKFRQLIKEGMNVNCYYNCNNTLISLVVSNHSRIPYNRNNDYFDILIENNVSLEVPENCTGLLSFAIFRDNKYIFKKLIENKININSQDDFKNYNSGEPIIFEAIEKGEYYYLDLVLNKNLYIDARSEIDETILNEFIKSKSNLSIKNDIEIFQRFIDLGCDVNDRGYMSIQAIHCIAFTGKNYLFDVLFNGKTEVELNSRDGQGNTALILAIVFSNFDAVDTLIKKGSAINIYNSNGHCPLFTSIIYDNDKIFNLLLENNAATLTIDNNNNNILHNMIQNKWEYGDGYQKYYEKIIEKHPELLFAKNKNGKTPIDLLPKNKSKNKKEQRKNEFFKNIINKIDHSKININDNLSL